MDKIGALLPQLAGLSNKDSNSAQGRAARNITDSEPAPSKAVYCLQRMRIMVACYRKDETSNPDEYAGAGAAVLAEYDLTTVDFVTDPRTGLPSHSQWLPTIKEIRDACESVVASEKAKLERDAGLRRQFKERAEFDAERADRGKRLSYDELKAKYGDDWGLTVPPDETDEAKQRRLRVTAESTERMILAEYEHAGLEPSYAAPGVLISPALVEYGRKHADEMRQHIEEREREPKP